MTTVLVMYWGVLESRKYEDDINWTMIGMYATDAIIGVAIPCGFIVGASTKTSSASETRHAVNGWANIGWYGLANLKPETVCAGISVPIIEKSSSVLLCILSHIVLMT